MFDEVIPVSAAVFADFDYVGEGLGHPLAKPRKWSRYVVRVPVCAMGRIDGEWHPLVLTFEGALVQARKKEGFIRISQGEAWAQPMLRDAAAESSKSAPPMKQGWARLLEKLWPWK